VHKGVHDTVLASDGSSQRLRQRFRVFGLPKTDEIEVTLSSEGHVVQDFLSGDLAGGPERTHLTAAIRAPLHGMNRVIAPLVKRVVDKLTDQALEEDRVDLEQRGYHPPSS
jgi:hypothetical protein